MTWDNFMVHGVDNPLNGLFSKSNPYALFSVRIKEQTS